MRQEPEFLKGGDPSILLLCDHASNHVPADIDLGIATELLDKHVAIDIGAGALTKMLSDRLDAPAIVATVSRLIIDLHREPDHPGLIPLVSDGHVIAGNRNAARTDRIARFYAPYHDAIARQIRDQPPKLIVAIHSFTPALESAPAQRPWEIGVLYNRDDRAAVLALDWLHAHDIVTGDNEPYSGKRLNATLNRHGEGNGIACVSIEVRNDLIADEAGVAHWAKVLAEMIGNLRNSLAFSSALEK